jgi:hypothetical protein
MGKMVVKVNTRMGKWIRCQGWKKPKMGKRSSHHCCHWKEKLRTTTTNNVEAEAVAKEGSMVEAVAKAVVVEEEGEVKAAVEEDAKQAMVQEVVAKQAMGVEGAVQVI